MSVELVKQVKDYLVSQGESLDGPCGAFKITVRVAGLLGVGTLSKPAGNNCEGHAVDQVCWPDGTIRDCLGDAGGANTPMWGEPEQIDPSRYLSAPRWAFPPHGGDGVLPIPSPLPAPIPDSVDLTPLLTRLTDIEQRLSNLETKPTPVVRYKVSGSTNRVWGHAHDVNLTITEDK